MMRVDYTKLYKSQSMNELILYQIARKEYIKNIKYD